MNKDELQRNIATTYTLIRIGLGAIGILLPVFLWLVGRGWYGVPLQDSMSAYYHATPDPTGALWTLRGWLAGFHVAPIDFLLSILGQTDATTPMRSWFVGGLFVMGVFLFLYRGFSTAENWLLNISGLCSIGVAVFPSGYDCASGCRVFAVHGVFAVVSFLSAGCVAYFLHDQTLKLTKDGQTRQVYRFWYRITAIVMVVLPVSAWLISLWLGFGSGAVFFIEAAGLWAFAAYWLLKTVELRGAELTVLAKASTYSLKRVKRLNGLINAYELERVEDSEGRDESPAGALAPAG
jgi:hypothetical protein